MAREVWQKNNKLQKTSFSYRVSEGCMGCMGCITIFLGLTIFFPFILGGLFWLAVQEYDDVEWHYKDYYLQQMTAMGDQTGNALFYQVGSEKVEILPHVYGYEKKDGLVYLAAAEGYGVIDLQAGTAKVMLLSEHIPQVAITKITYEDDLHFLSIAEQKRISSLPHITNAYFVESSWRDGETFTIGDGRFQYDYARVGETKYHYFQVHGLYGDFDCESRLFDDLTGFQIDERVAMMYVTSPHGYAIVDGLRGTCRVYFTDPVLAEKEYQKDIYVLDSFEDFTPEEQEILRQVEKDGLP